MILYRNGKKINPPRDTVDHYLRQGWFKEEPHTPKVDPQVQDLADAPALPERPPQAPEEVKPAPSIAEMRKWALDNDIEGVKDKGKLPRHAIEAYLKAHEEN